MISVELIGVFGKGATRWINLFGFSIQPSELIKITIILALARFYHDLKFDENSEMHFGGGGLVSTMSNYSNFCEMLVNDGVFRGNRIFQSMFNKVIELAKNQDGVVAVKLHVHTNNNSAIKAYERSGMKRTPEYPYIYNIK